MRHTGAASGRVKQQTSSAASSPSDGRCQDVAVLRGAPEGHGLRDEHPMSCLQLRHAGPLLHSASGGACDAQPVCGTRAGELGSAIGARGATGANL
jgi:hypothetical protein